MDEGIQYVVGGTVQAGGGVYLERPADRQLLEHCRRGEFVYILTARQLGKSSLMIRTAETLIEEGCLAVVIDLQSIGTPENAEQWYRGLLLELESQLELNTNVAEWWRQHDDIGYTHRLTRFLREVVAESTAKRVVVFVDEIDTTLKLGYTDDFFIAIRYLYGARARDVALMRLSFVLLGVATPSDLIKDGHRTPFNVGVQVEMTDFTMAEALPLTPGVEAEEEERELLLRRVLHWTGGHPYLTLRAFQELREQAPVQWSAAVVDECIARLFFGEQSSSDHNIQFVYSMLTDKALERSRALESLVAIQRGREVRDRKLDHAVNWLKLSGVVRVDAGHLQVRNRIYERVFSTQWAQENRGIDWARRFRWLAVGVGSLGLAAVVGAGVQAIQPDPCEEVASRMTAIWTEDARSDIEAAFTLVESAGRWKMSNYLVDRLDHAAAQWSERAMEVCQAIEHASVVERPALDRRAKCLDRWAQSMQNRIEWLRAPNQVGREHAFELVVPLAHAGDSCSLPPVLIDAAVEEAIGRAEQAELVRDLDSAKALANEAVDVARARGILCAAQGPDGDPRSSELAAAFFRLGHVLGERGESDAALEALRWAHQHAYACSDDHRDAEAKIHAAILLASDLEDVDAAAASLDDAWVALRRVEEPVVSLRRYDERIAAGIVAGHLGDYEGARRHADEARAALGDPAHEPVLDARLDANMGVAWHRQQAHDKAAAAYERAAQRVGQVLGQQHPQTRLYAARRSLNLGLAAQQLKEYVQMRRYFAEAAASSETSVVAMALTAWAVGELEAEDTKAASARAAALLAFLDRSLALSPIDLATLETTAGQVLAVVGDPEGIPVLERACARWREGTKSNERAACELALGSALRDAGRVDEARRVVERLRVLVLEESPTGPLQDAIYELERSLVGRHARECGLCPDGDPRRP